MTISEETLAWLRQSAFAGGVVYSQVLLHLLERVERVERLEVKCEAQRLATLAQLEGVGTTDEELLEAAAKALGYKSIPSDETCLTAEAGELLAFARAVLAHWGRPAHQPIPIAERLPGEGDCDAEGRCWLLHVDRLGLLQWHFLDRYPSFDSYSYYGYTHWLPYWALPLPEEADA